MKKQPLFILFLFPLILFSNPNLVSPDDLIGRWEISADVPMNSDMKLNLEGEIEYLESRDLLLSWVFTVYYVNRTENFLEFAVTATGSWKFEEGKYIEKMNDDFKIEHLICKDPRIGFEVARFVAGGVIAPSNDPEWIAKNTVRVGNTLAVSAGKFSYVMTKIEPIGIGLPITEEPSHTTTHTGP